jgi:hypothetical protein
MRTARRRSSGALDTVLAHDRFRRLLDQGVLATRIEETDLADHTRARRNRSG